MTEAEWRELQRIVVETHTERERGLKLRKYCFAAWPQRCVQAATKYDALKQKEIIPETHLQIETKSRWQADLSWVFNEC